MARVLVLYSSSYGHIETMAEAVADGARFQERHVAETALALAAGRQGRAA